MRALDAEHSQGAAKTAGDALWQIVYEGETLCAVLVWCACAFRLKARDAWIGWDDVTRARRLKLIVQNRRFLVLEAARRPNLASQRMGAALRALPSTRARRSSWSEAAITSCRSKATSPASPPQRSSNSKAPPFLHG